MIHGEPFIWSVARADYRPSPVCDHSFIISAIEGFPMPYPQSLDDRSEVAIVECGRCSKGWSLPVIWFFPNGIDWEMGQ